jgi:hypothetical protein
MNMEVNRAARELRGQVPGLSWQEAVAWAWQCRGEARDGERRQVAARQAARQAAFFQERREVLRSEGFRRRLAAAGSTLEGAQPVERGFRFPVEFYACGSLRAA